MSGRGQKCTRVDTQQQQPWRARTWSSTARQESCRRERASMAGCSCCERALTRRTRWAIRCVISLSVGSPNPAPRLASPHLTTAHFASPRLTAPPLSPLLSPSPLPSQAWPQERLRLAGIAKRKMRRLESGGVELDMLQLVTSYHLLLDPPAGEPTQRLETTTLNQPTPMPHTTQNAHAASRPPNLLRTVADKSLCASCHSAEDREEERIWAIEFFNDKMYDFVVSANTALRACAGSPTLTPLQPSVSLPPSLPYLAPSLPLTSLLAFPLLLRPPTASSSSASSTSKRSCFSRHDRRHLPRRRLSASVPTALPPPLPSEPPSTDRSLRDPRVTDRRPSTGNRASAPLVASRRASLTRKRRASGLLRGA